MRRLSPVRPVLPVLLILASCHDAQAPAGDFQLDASHAATVRLGLGGGMVATTGADGRRYTLRIPAGALRDSTDITVTPVIAFDDLPEGVTLRAAAQFAPEGLALAVPATLRIEGAGVSATSGDLRVTGLAWTGQGDDPYRSLAGFAGDTLVVPVFHFSGAGAAVTADASLIPAPPQSADEAQAVWLLSAEAANARYSPGCCTSDIVRILTNWYHDLVEPALQLASTDVELSHAVHYYLAWEEMIACGGYSCSSVNVFDETGPAPSPHYFWETADEAQILSGLATTRQAARQVLLNALEHGIDRDVQQCKAGHDLQAAANAEYWAKWDIVSGGSAPDPVARCVSVVIEQLSFPSSVSQGQATPLAVTAGLRFVGDATPVHNFNLDVTVSASGATPATANGLTATGTGLYSTTLAPDGSGPVFLGIRVQWRLIVGQLGGLLRDTTAEAALDSHITITPTAAILNTSTQAGFTATVTGLASSGVTWSATGGTLSTTSGPSTTYTAGITPGTYAVTATATADPTQHVSARIDIVGASVPAGGRILNADGRLDPFAQALFTACNDHDLIAPTAIPASLSYSATATCPTITESDQSGHTGSGYGSTRQSYQVVTADGTLTGDLSSITIDGQGMGTASGYSGMGEGSSRMALCFSIPQGATYHYVLSGALSITGAGRAEATMRGPATFAFMAGENPLTGEVLPPNVQLNATGALPGGSYCFDAVGVASASVFNGVGVGSAEVHYSDVKLQIVP